MLTKAELDNYGDSEWKRKAEKRARQIVCHDCGCHEGRLHEMGCDMERCPFCGNQLISCFCCYYMLDLVDDETYPDTDGLSPDIYENGLSDEQERAWASILSRAGRIPYIRYPIVCACCGKLWPDLFMVSDDEWNKNIQKDMRRTVICRDCFQYIRYISH